MDTNEERLEQDCVNVRAGDQDALARCFEQYRDRLAGIVRFRMDPILFKRVEIDDVLQEVFIAANNRIQAFAEGGFQSVFVWLRLIAIQSLIDLQRHHLGAEKRDVFRERRIRGMQSTTAITSWILVEHLVAHSISPSQILQRDELMKRINVAICKLDSGDQEIIALRHFEELRNAEVAELLNVSVKTASIRYARALKRLKIVLRDVPGFTALNTKIRNS